jgi:integrase/recombinase XerD
VAAFLGEEAQGMSISTVKRRIEAIKFAHRMSDVPSPASHSEVRLALRRAARSKRQRPEQALGLTGNLLEKMLAACGSDLDEMRDAALVSVGYDTLCRSAELVAMRVEHLSADNTTILVPHSKADPFGVGRIAYLSPATIERLNRWLDAACICDGPLFRGLHTAKVSSRPLTTPSVRRIIKRVAPRSGLAGEVTKRLSGHSMRVGAAQDMMLAGVETIGIMQAGGWKTVDVVARYVENASARNLHERRWARLSC